MATETVDVHDDLRQRLVGLARRLCGDASEAEDVVQDVLMRAATRDAQLRDVRRRDAWLLRICRHAAIDHVRSRRVRRAVWLPMSPEVSENAAAREPSGDDLAEREVPSRESLPAHQRLLVDLHYGRGVAQSDLCRMTGLTSCALRVRLYRARGLLIDAVARAAAG